MQFINTKSITSIVEPNQSQKEQEEEEEEMAII